MCDAQGIPAKQREISCIPKPTAVHVSQRKREDDAPPIQAARESPQHKAKFPNYTGLAPIRKPKAALPIPFLKPIRDNRVILEPVWGAQDRTERRLMKMRTSKHAVDGASSRCGPPLPPTPAGSRRASRAPRAWRACGCWHTRGYRSATTTCATEKAGT